MIHNLSTTSQATARRGRALRGREPPPWDIRCPSQLEVGHGLANHFGTLHGGATSLIVDVLGTMALLTKDVSRPGATLACRLLPLEVIFCCWSRRHSAQSDSQEFLTEIESPLQLSVFVSQWAKISLFGPPNDDGYKRSLLQARAVNNIKLKPWYKMTQVLWHPTRDRNLWNRH